MKKKKEQKHSWSKWDWFSVIAISFLFVCALLYFVVISTSDELNNIHFGGIAEEHVKKNKLVVPLPNSDQLVEYGAFESRRDHLDFLGSLSLEDFSNHVNQVYSSHYEVNTYDCKYWAYVWTLYYQENKDNWNIKYITTDNHILGIVILSLSAIGYIIKKDD